MDFLRAVAVCLVLADHVVEASQLPSLWWVAERIGWMGVMLFFVHTSLVLMFSLERTNTNSRSALLKHFYVRRAFRIYPLSVCVVILVVVLHIPVAHWYFQPVDASLSTVAANLLLVQNLLYAPSVLGPLWSLPLEVQMYIVLPFLFWLVRGGQRLGAAVAVWVISVCLAFLQPHISERVNVLQFAPCFSAGLLAYCLSRRRPVLPFWLFAVSLGVLATAFLLVTTDRQHAHILAASWILTLAVGWLLPHFQETRSLVLQRSCSLIAKYSYGIYLTHMIALWVSFVALGRVHVALRALAGVSLIVGLPVAAYRWIEEPAIRLGRRFAEQLLQS